MSWRNSLPMKKDLEKLIRKGESATLEFKRSTGELRQALWTLCAFANGAGGKVIIGVKPDGRIVGQQVSEAAAELDCSVALAFLARAVPSLSERLFGEESGQLSCRGYRI